MSQHTAQTAEGFFKISGKGYPERWADTKIAYPQGITVADVIALGHAENEAAVVRAFYGQFNIRASGEIKKAAAEVTSTVDTLRAILVGYKILAERQKGGGGGNPEALKAAAETRARNKADAAVMAQLREKAASDPRLAKLLEQAKAIVAGE